jgi:endonuclease YncB( thermonuclease family)
MLKTFLFLLTIAALCANFSVTAQTDKTASTVNVNEGVLSEVFATKRKVYEGKVVSVHDGDTATVLDSEKVQHKIRFNGIDAPELRQPFGAKAKKNLSKLIFGKRVRVVSEKEDKYGREVSVVYLNDVDINLQQIRAGFAWHYKKYATEQSVEQRAAYSEAEEAAREAGIGLWKNAANQQPPWEYRGELTTQRQTARASRKYQRGAKGGCYYINARGGKTYAAREKCSQ